MIEREGLIDSELMGEMKHH